MGNITHAGDNLVKLGTNAYPGRGIVLGMTPDAQSLVQIYWIMGRSENSRNRIFVAEGTSVKTKAFDESKCTDPSLIIYYPARTVERAHVVTNGDQTDTIRDALGSGGSFISALDTREFEPDAPNFTPRISGITDQGDPLYAYRLSILRAIPGGGCARFHFSYEKALPGFGHCIHTYAHDGNPLPPFEGEPYPVPIGKTIDEIATQYWNTLNAENRISLMVKTISAKSGESRVTIINKLG
jgi:IMP cyclohydrolase